MSAVGRFLRTPEGAIGTVLLTALAFVALSAPFIFPGDPLRIAGPSYLRPFVDPAFPLGTDSLGRNVFAGVMHGARTSLVIGIAAATAAIVAGSIVGTLAGFIGGVIDEVLMRISDAFQTVPAFLLALAFVSVVGPSMTTLVAAIALSAWTAPARIARAEVLSIRQRDYVAAARAVGMHPLVIAFREVLPNALPPVLTLASVIVASSILIEAALSFLGLGDPNRATWGTMIAEGRSVLRSHAYLSIFPGIALVTTVIAIYFAGEGAVEASQSRRVLA